MTKDEVYDTTYYLKSALAGGICCSITHGAVTPLDVVKTRIQLDPVKYNKGFIGGFRQVIQGEGAGALLTGLGATATGYFVQGWFKFVRFFFFFAFLKKRINKVVDFTNIIIRVVLNSLKLILHTN